MIPADFYPVTDGRLQPPFSGNKPSQNRAELLWLCDYLVALGCRSWLEIGAREGDTFRAVAGVLPAGSRMVAIDLPGDRWGRANTQPLLERAVADANAAGHQARVIWGDSQQTETRIRLGWDRFDAVLIDADHTYDGVKRDWELYGPLADKLVAFHDIAGEGQQSGRLPVEVPRLWAEIKAERDTASCIAEGSRMGIGVVLVGG